MIRTVAAFALTAFAAAALALLGYHWWVASQPPRRINFAFVVDEAHPFGAAPPVGTFVVVALLVALAVAAIAAVAARRWQLTRVAVTRRA
ncbi:hypothetical protein [Rhodococcus sp. HNM0569]|uniref:hypothetical protein n=1 Tax=Rhodococcus sp. HNM0569 TaxID=2716340 RepID=UPI00146E6109|nr:hypothetical protein [Rhodococcus sp. HNM0569]NLU83092.1 hypothetical protein [Rhodococcus sp. HNM0569]